MNLYLMQHGATLPQAAKANQSDAAFLKRIQNALILARGTRGAVVAAITNLTGAAPVIIEPGRPSDCGSYSGWSAGYGVAGAYGSLSIPYQAFVQVVLPKTGGIPNANGWGGYSGGYGVGAIEWADLGMVVGQITAQDAYDTINAVKPEGTTVWVRAA